MFANNMLLVIRYLKKAKACMICVRPFMTCNVCSRERLDYVSSLM